MTRRTRVDVWFAVAAVLLAAALVALVVAAVRDAELGRASEILSLLLVALGTLAGLLAWREARGVERLARDLEQREVALQQRQTEIARTLDELDAEAHEERDRRQQVERWLETERRFTRELRHRIDELQRAHGALGDARDVPQLVLRTAISLLGARKGLLLSRLDDDGDGDLDLIAAHGFEHDPAESAIAQRFAREVLASDETVRQDDPGGDVSPADEEIDNLVAIPIYMQDRFSGVVVCANKPGGFHEHDDEILLALGNHAGAVLQNARLHGELRSAYLATVAMLGEAIEASDPFLRGHSIDVTRYVSGVADALGLDARRREELVFGALLHDVGKIGITERILLKPAPLTDEERATVELHPRIGYRLVQRVPALRGIAPAILHHHERYDGRGYPTGLAREQIPLEARIIAVADSFSAMTADRPYRPRMTVEEACAELERCAGTQFDPEIVRHFLAQVRAHPPVAADGAVVDAEIEVRRAAGEAVLGYGSIAMTDNVTLLYAHRHFHEAAHAEAERAAVQKRPFGVLLVELTELAQLNAERGYDAGDEALREVARCVEGVAVQCGGTAARYSGRRIGLVAPGADASVVERLAEQIATELGGRPAVRVACAAWREGEGGGEVVRRARAELGLPVLT